MEEARKDKRVSAEFPVRVKSATVGEFVDRLAADVSLGGIFIQAAPPLDVGTLVRVEFHVDDGTQLCTGVGRVVWNRGEDVATPDKPMGMGVKFVRVDTATKDVLLSFVERRASEVSIERRVVVLPESTLSQRPPPETDANEVPTPIAPPTEELLAKSAPEAEAAEAKADVSSLAALDARISDSTSAEDETEDEDEDDERAADETEEEDAAASASNDDDEEDEEESASDDDEEEDEEEEPAAASSQPKAESRPSARAAAQTEASRAKKRGKKARKEEARQRKREKQKQAAAEVARKEQSERTKPAKDRPSRPQELPVAEARSGSRSMLPIVVVVAIIIAIVLGIYLYSSSQSDSNSTPGQETSAD